MTVTLFNKTLTSQAYKAHGQVETEIWNGKQKPETEGGELKSETGNDHTTVNLYQR